MPVYKSVPPVQAATVGEDIPLQGTFTLDGVQLRPGYRVLVKDQVEDPGDPYVMEGTDPTFPTLHQPGNLTLEGGLAVYGNTPPGKAARPTTVAHVIKILQDLGFCE